MPAERDPVATSVWVRPTRARGGAAGQPTLSREHIVRAAVELLDDEGYEGLSMRRLGARLGSGTTSVYWYVANKDDLLELAVDQIMGEIEVPDPRQDGWRAAAAAVGWGMRSMVLRHPWCTALLGTRPNIGPNAMRLTDRTIAALEAAGFTGIELSHAATLLVAHTYGSSSNEVAWQRATAHAGVQPEEVMQSFDQYQKQIAADYPSYDKWWRENRDTASELDRLRVEGFAFGLERLLDGLEAWLEKQKRDQPREPADAEQDA